MLRSDLNVNSISLRDLLTSFLLILLETGEKEEKIKMAGVATKK